MLHLIRNSLKIKLKTPYIVFWPMLFPLIMATLFYVALNDLDEGKFETIPVCVVEVEGEKEGMQSIIFKEFLKVMENDSSDMPIIDVKYKNEKDALAALENQEIKGIFYSGETIKLTLFQDGYGESILKSIYEGFVQNYDTMERIVTSSSLTPNFTDEKLHTLITNFTKDTRTTFVQDCTFRGNSLKITSSFFYALIGMSCLYGCFIGLSCTDILQANLSKAAIRCSVAPVHKLKLILSEMAASFGLHFANVILLLIYLRYFLKISLTGNLPMMLLVVFFGSLIGVSLGIFIGSLKSKSEDMKVGILLVTSMSFSFLAGLMNNQMKYLVEKKFPLLNRINPAALISDAMYCLNIYEDTMRFTTDIILLFVISFFLILAAFISVRRVRYDSL